jgi:hypothetical protein
MASGKCAGQNGLKSEEQEFQDFKTIVIPFLFIERF